MIYNNSNWICVLPCQNTQFFESQQIEHWSNIHTRNLWYRTKTKFQLLLRVRLENWPMFTILWVYRQLSLGLSTQALVLFVLYPSCRHHWGSEGNELGLDSACVLSLLRCFLVDLPSWLTLSRPSSKQSVSDYVHGSWKHHLHIGQPWAPSPRPIWYKNTR